MELVRFSSLFSVVTIAWLLTAPASGQEFQGGRRPENRAFLLNSGSFRDGGYIPVRHTQAAQGVEPGKGVSPALMWNGAPEGTQSFLLRMHDMNVARNRTTEDQVHWLVWNIPATAWSLAEGMPEGAKLADGSYQISATGPMYRGPGAPASGAHHHYMFELLALDITLDMPATGDAFETRRKLMEAVQGHVLGKALLIGLFRQPPTLAPSG